MINLSGFNLDYRPALTLIDSAGETFGLDDYDNLVPISPPEGGGEVYEDEDGQSHWVQYHGEVSIATIQLKSTLSDWIDLRARREGDRIRYRYVDEYPDSVSLDTYLETPAYNQSGLPTMREVIHLLDESRQHDLGKPVEPAGIMFTLWENAKDEDTSEGRRHGFEFATIGSDLYPELGAYYEDIGHYWVETGKMITLRDIEAS